MALVEKVAFLKRLFPVLISVFVWECIECALLALSLTASVRYLSGSCSNRLIRAWVKCIIRTKTFLWLKCFCACHSMDLPFQTATAQL